MTPSRYPPLRHILFTRAARSGRLDAFSLELCQPVVVTHNRPNYVPTVPHFIACSSNNILDCRRPIGRVNSKKLKKREMVKQFSNKILKSLRRFQKGLYILLYRDSYYIKVISLSYTKLKLLVYSIYLWSPRKKFA